MPQPQQQRHGFGRTPLASRGLKFEGWSGGTESLVSGLHLAGPYEEIQECSESICCMCRLLWQADLSRSYFVHHCGLLLPWYCKTGSAMSQSMAATPTVLCPGAKYFPCDVGELPSTPSMGYLPNTQARSYSCIRVPNYFACDNQAEGIGMSMSLLGTLRQPRSPSPCLSRSGADGTRR